MAKKTKSKAKGKQVSTVSDDTTEHQDGNPVIAEAEQLAMNVDDFHDDDVVEQPQREREEELHCCDASRLKNLIPTDTPVPETFMEAASSLLKEADILTIMQKAHALHSRNASVPLDVEKTAAVIFFLQGNNAFSLNQAISKAVRERLKEAASASAASESEDAEDEDAEDEDAVAARFLRPWIKYIRLLAEALNQLPNTDMWFNKYLKQNVFRKYKRLLSQEICWPTFSLLKDDDDDDYDDHIHHDEWTRISLQCKRAKDVGLFCEKPPSEEKPFVIMGTTWFRVKFASFDDCDGCRVGLREIDRHDSGLYPMLGITSTYQRVEYEQFSTTRSLPSRAAKKARHAEEMVTVVMCPKHHKKIEVVCHDCGDVLECEECMKSHVKKSDIADVPKYCQERLMSKVGTLNGLQEELEQGLSQLQERLRAMDDQKTQLRIETAAVFDELKVGLHIAKQRQLKLIDKACMSRSKWLKNQCDDLVSTLNQLKTPEAASAALSSSSVTLLLQMDNKVAENIKFGTASIQRLKQWDQGEGIGGQLKRRDNIVVQRNESAIHNLRVWTNRLTSPVRDYEILNKDLLVNNIRTIDLVELDGPISLCRVTADLIAIVEQGLSRIALLSLTTKNIVESYGSEYLQLPTSVCLNSDNHFVVTDYDQNKVFIFHRDGGMLIAESNPSVIPLLFPRRICFDKNKNRFIVLDSRRLVVISHDLRTVIGTYDDQCTCSMASGLAVDSKGRIFVANGESNVHVYEEEISSTGEISYINTFDFGCESNGDTAIFSACSLFIDAEDTVLVGDSDKWQICVYNNKGAHIRTLECELKGIDDGICLDGMGRIIVTAGDRVVLIEPEE